MSDTGYNLLNLKGRGNIISAAHFKDFILIQDLTGIADKNDWDLTDSFICFEVLTELIAICEGHLGIEQNQIGGSRLDCP